MLRLLAIRPNLSQRQIASALGISLGKANYCMRALVDGGWITAQRMRDSDNRPAYAYVVTPQGSWRMMRLAARFLEQKRHELEALKREIELLNSEVTGNDTDKRKLWLD